MSARMISCFRAVCFVAALLASAGAEAAGRSLGALPVAMRGLWSFSADGCTKAGDDGRVQIGRTSVQFFASSFHLRRIVQERGGSVRARALIDEEGEPGRSRGAIALRLVASDRLSITTETIDAHVYLRCALS